MSGLAADDVDAVANAIKVLDEAGFDVDGIDDVGVDRHGYVIFRAAIRAPARVTPIGSHDATVEEQEVSPTPEDPDETEGGDTSDGEANGDGGGRDVAVAETTPESEPYGTFEARDYGLVLTGDVPDHFDAERVSVVGRPYGADLVPGTEPDSAPDYAVSGNQVQLGNPGREAIGADPGDEVRAIPDGEAVRLEVLGGGGDGVDGDDTDNQDGDDTDGAGDIEHPAWAPDDGDSRDDDVDEPTEWTDWDGDGATADGGARGQPAYAPDDLGTYTVGEREYANRDNASPVLSLGRPVGRALNRPAQVSLVEDGGEWYIERGGDDDRVSIADDGQVRVGAVGVRDIGLDVGAEVVAHEAGSRVRLEVSDS